MKYKYFLNKTRPVSTVCNNVLTFIFIKKQPFLFFNSQILDASLTIQSFPLKFCAFCAKFKKKSTGSWLLLISYLWSFLWFKWSKNITKETLKEIWITKFHERPIEWFLLKEILLQKPRKLFKNSTQKFEEEKTWRTFIN